MKCYTESEAPYYYFATKAAFQNVESVAVMDIGGGSTDIVYYAKGEAKIANSVHFGCDVLWENGYNQFVNARDNGIFKHYKDKIHFDTNELKELYEAMLKSNHTSTRDIINLWISNDKETEISKKLRADHISTFVYHYTALVYYMSAMFKANGLPYPRTIIFSGNGSKYIDNYITDSKTCLKQITELIVSRYMKRKYLTLNSFCLRNVKKVPVMAASTTAQKQRNRSQLFTWAMAAMVNTKMLRQSTQHIHLA